jgi:hypothetical protein
VFRANTGVVIASYNTHAITIVNTLIVDNIGAGVVDFVGGGPSICVNCTIANNGAIGYSSGHPYASITNSIVWGNGNAQIMLFDDLIQVTYCDIQGGFPGEGNTSANPHFFGDYRLDFLSECADAGTNAVVDPCDVDLDGNRRRTDSFWPDTGFGDAPVVDMGAYETQSTPADNWS